MWNYDEKLSFVAFFDDIVTLSTTNSVLLSAFLKMEDQCWDHSASFSGTMLEAFSNAL